MRPLIKWLEGRSPVQMSALGALLVAVLALAELHGPERLAYTSMFLLLTAAVGWFGGVTPAVITAAAAAGYMSKEAWESALGQPFHWIDWVNLALRWGSCAGVGWLAVALRQSREDLEARVAWRTEELQKLVWQHEGTESRLRESQERFAELADNIHEAFWVTDVQRTRPLYISSGYERIWGRSCQSLHESPHSWFEAIHPDDRALVSQWVKAEPFQESRTMEYRIRRPDGTERWIRDRAVPIRDAQGATIRFVGLAEDITKAQQTRQLLQLQASVLGSMSEAVVLTDHDHRIALTNQAADRLLGYEPGALLGQPGSTVLTIQEERCAPLLRTALAALDAGGVWTGDFHVRQRDGGTCLCAARMTRLASSDQTFHITVLRDVTEQRRTQATLRLQALVLQTMAEGVVLVGPDQTIRLTNPALETNFGYAPGELLGQRVSVMNVWSEEETASYNRLIMQAIAERGVWTGEYANRRKDGSRFFSQARISAFTLDGEVHHVSVQQDITARKEVEEALRVSEEKFATSFRSSPDAFILSSVPESRITEVNEATSRISGYTREELLSRTTLELGLWADPDARARYITVLRREGRVAEFETVFRCKSGDIRACLISGEIIQLQSGPHFLSVIRDITERKRVEEALLVSEDKFAKAFRASPDAIILSAIPDGRIVEVNDSAVCICGYERAEMLGSTTVALGLWADLEARDRCVAQVRRDGRLKDFEAALYHKSGRLLTCLLSAEIVQLQNGPHYLSVIRDVTQQKLAEEQARRWQQVFEKAEFALAHTSVANNTFLAVNPACAKERGYTPEELVGQPITLIYPPEVLPVMRERMSSIDADGHMVFESVHRRKDGSTFPVLVEVTTIRDAQGRPASRVAYALDITERKQAEAAIRESEEKYRVLFAESPDAYFVLADGRMADCNRAAEVMLHGDRQQILGLTPIDLSPPVQPDGRPSEEAAAEMIAVALAAGSHRFEWVHRRFDGQDFWAGVSTSVMVQRGRKVLFSSWRDITDRKQAQEALRKSEEMLSRIVNSVEDIIYSVDGQTEEFGFLSPAFERRLGYTVDDIRQMGGRKAFLRQVLQEGLFEKQDLVWQELRSQAMKEAPRWEAWWRCRDGNFICLEDRSTPLFSGDRFLGTQGVLRDVTAQKQAEASVRQANRQIEESKAFYLSILESIKSGVVVSSGDDFISYANRAFAAIAGAGREEVVKLHALDGFGEGTVGQLASYYGKARSTLQPVPYEAVPVLTPGGRATYQSGWFLPRVGAEGYAGMICTVEDVTERIEAERLTEAQRELVLALSSLDELHPAVELLLQTATHLDRLDCGGVYLLNSENGDLELVAHVGLSPGFVQAVSLVKTDTQPARLVMSGQPLYGPSTGFDPDMGNQLVAEGLRGLVVVPLRDGANVIGSLNLGARTQDEISLATLAFVEGIAAQAGGAIARIRAQEARRQSEIRLRTIINHAPIALVAVDNQGRITFSDGRALQAIHELPNQHDGLLLAETPLCRRAPIVLEHARRALAGEAFTTRLDVGSVAFEISYSPHCDRQGAPNGFIAVANNVTDRLRLERELLETTEREQARIGQDIHDDLCQQLVGIAFGVNSLAESLSARSHAQAAKARRIAEYLDAALTHARQLARGLFPVKLETDGLCSALQELAASVTKRHPLRCLFENPTPVLITDNTLATHLFRIAQEATNNALRHARASEILIRLAQEQHQIELTITDNGCGLPNEAASTTGMGRHIMEYRARSLRGTLRIHAGATGGTVVCCCIPLPPA